MTITKYTKKDRKTYYKVKLYAGNGQYVSKSSLKSEAEAKAMLKTLQRQLDQNEYKKRSTKTYQDVYDLWVTEYEHTVEESTLVKTLGIFKNHILPALGKEKIDQLDYEKCRNAVYDWADKLKNFRMVKSYASKVIDFAIKHEQMKSNPFALVEPPRKRKTITLDEKEHENFYTAEQLLTFLDCMKKEKNTQAYVFFRLLAFSGIRRGEAIALTWKDVDFKRGEIRINKAVSRNKTSLYLKSTKTGVNRTIKMDPETMEILEKWKKTQRLKYLVLGFNTNKASQLVFCNEQNDFLQLTKPRKWLVHVLEKYKLPKISVHGFRHTHASILYSANVQDLEISTRLGHASLKMTMDIYTHLKDKTTSEAIHQFADYLKTGTQIGTE